MKRTLLPLNLIFCLFIFNGCVQEEPDPDPVENETLQLVEAFPNLSFDRPLEIQYAGDGSDRLFVVEQPGVISVFPNQSEVAEKDVFLDIESQVEDEGNEEGLLGLAFHPDYASNGYLFVNYTAANPARTVVSRFEVMASDPDRADPQSEMILLEVEQPFSNHNGGKLAFGPDGYLYISLGDGGSAGDPEENGQNPATLLGSILRIDVDEQTAEMNYGIPADNPFAGNEEGFREEIFAYGLRNVWKFSFDQQTNLLWAADVGQNELEEINLIDGGENYGWNTMEGFDCFEPASDCDQDGLSLPIWDYDHDEGDRSITGGYVYRGEEIPELVGQYIYADFVSGRIWAMDFSTINDPDVTELIQASFPVSSFGLDQENELLISGFDGNIYKLEYQSE